MFHEMPTCSRVIRQLQQDLRALRGLHDAGPEERRVTSSTLRLRTDFVSKPTRELETFVASLFSPDKKILGGWRTGVLN